jgi:hypothetical protein
VAPRDYIWDSQAARRIQEQELDRHYEQNQAHYDDLAESLWEHLNEVSDQPGYLKHDDLWDVLHPVLTRDSTMLREFARKRLPAPMARGGSQWVAWFSHYVTERFLEGREEAPGDG